MANKRPLLVAIIFGIIAVILVYAYIKSKEQEMATEQVEYGTVVVARKKISPRTEIRENDVKEVQWPVEIIPSKAYTEMDEVLGKISNEAIFEDVPLIPDQFSERTEMGELSFILEAGQRAVTIGVTEIKGVGGNIKPGDHVNVLATFTGEEEVGEPVTYTVLRDVPVVAVGRDIGVEEDGGEGQPISKSITLAVDPREAERLILADETGDIRLSLRPQDDYYAPPSGGVRLPDIVAYSPTRAEREKKEKANWDERLKEKDSQIAQLERQIKFLASLKGEPIPPLEEPVPVADGELIEVIRGGEKETVKVPRTLYTGGYSVWPMQSEIKIEKYNIYGDG